MIIYNLVVIPTMTIAPSTTFRKWIENRKPTKEELERYIQSLGEWISSEYKATTDEDGSNIRKAVCALANKAGGEVFIGISNERKVVGTILTPQQITQILLQENAPKGDWFAANLTEVVPNCIQIQFIRRKRKALVYILEVKPPGIPVFTYEKGKMILYIRQGESSMPADAFKSLSWNKEINRENILRTLYLEFRTLGRRMSSDHKEIFLGMGLTLPYLQKILEDGTIYRYLTDEDLKFLLGEHLSSGGFSGAIYSEIFRLKYRIEFIIHFPYDLSRIDGVIEDLVRRAEATIRDITRRFEDYLAKEGILVSTRT